MDIFKRLFGTPQFISTSDTTPGDPGPDLKDVWAFTDPDAREKYASRGDVKRLEQDIRFEVMRGGQWTPEELEYKSEILRLLQEGVIEDKGTYWFRSPHSTVYRARVDGHFSVQGKVYRFSEEDEIVFQCRMERDEAGEDPGPALVSRMQPAKKAMLCGDMSNAMKGMP